MRTLALTATIVFSLSACSWVEVSPSGKNITLATNISQVASCKAIATINASVMNRFFFSRDQNKVATELVGLARNRAAEMGGNTVIANSAIDEGKQSFTVYNCP